MSWIDTFNHIWVDNIDKRTQSWFLVDSFPTVLMMFGVYLLVVYYIGPRYMQNRPPYSLKKFIQFYDVFQIFINAYLIYLLVDAGWYSDIWFYCVPFAYDTKPSTMKMASAVWLTMMIKFLDFIETVIYVLRKKNEQISALHVYHHISTAFLSWLGLRYASTGMGTTLIVVNSSVHVIMYTYYYLATLGPKVQKIILPYKPLLTIVQMVQFVGLIIYCSQAFLPSCNVHQYLAVITIGDLLMNFALFYNFYQTTYKPSKAKRK